MRANSRSLLALLVLLAAGVCRAEDPAAPAQAAGQPVLTPQQLGKLKVEYARIGDALAAVQARLAVLEQKLYDARLRVRLESELEDGYRLEALELELDGAPVTTREWQRAGPIQSLLLYEGYLEPGPHRLALHLWIRGPDQSADDEPGFLAASGLLVHLRQRASTEARFEVEMTGNANKALRRAGEPEADWSVDVTASFATEGNE